VVDLACPAVVYWIQGASNHVVGPIFIQCDRIGAPGRRLLRSGQRGNTAPAKAGMGRARCRIAVIPASRLCRSWACCPTASTV